LPRRVLNHRHPSATVLEAFGTGYYQIIPNTTNNGAYITLWDVSLCNTGTCGAVTTVVNFTVCSQWAIVLRAASAFYVMADVFVYLALIFSFLEYFAVGFQWLSVLFAILYVFCGIVGWAIIAGFYRGSYCGYVLSNSHQLYAGWATAVAGTGLVLIGVIFWLLRYCCCNPNKVRFNQPIAPSAPLVTPVVAPALVSTPAVYSPGMSYNSYPQGLNPTCISPAMATPPLITPMGASYASPMARVVPRF